MNLKKILSSVAIVGAIATMLGASAMAATIKLIPQGDGVVNTDSAVTQTVAPGSTIALDVVVADNPGAINLKLTTSWPKATFTYDSFVNSLTEIPYKSGVELDGDDGTTQKKEFYWAAGASPSNFVFNGTIGTMTFKVPENIADTEYTFPLTVVSRNVNLKNVSYTYVPLTIKVQSAPPAPTASMDTEFVEGEKLGGQYTFYAPLTVTVPEDAYLDGDEKLKFSIADTLETDTEKKEKLYNIPIKLGGLVSFTAIVKTPKPSTYECTVKYDGKALATAKSFTVKAQ